MNNLPLFADSHEELGHMLDQLDNIPETELQSRWPQLLADIVDLFSAELARQGYDAPAARLSAGKLAGSLAHYYGGRAVYLPTGDALKAALRDNQLFLDWTLAKQDVDGLARKYSLTNSTVYAILRQQMILHRKRYQPDLF
ncbi:Mor transcription activator family protein [Morganella morganii]|uniref:Mor transcription activator family protein n=1 Tax=Morganella morganii TaxID=582 RepID=UPI0032DA5654